MLQPHTYTLLDHIHVPTTVRRRQTRALPQVIPFNFPWRMQIFRRLMLKKFVLQTHTHAHTRTTELKSFASIFVCSLCCLIYYI